MSQNWWRGQGSVLCHNEAVLRWLISVGGLHSGGDKGLSIFGSFSFVRFKFRSAAFWRQNVRLVRTDNCLSFRRAVDKLLQLKTLNNQEIWKWKKKHLPVALIKLLWRKNYSYLLFSLCFWWRLKMGEGRILSQCWVLEHENISCS